MTTRRRLLQGAALSCCAAAGAWFAWQRLQPADPGDEALPLLFAQTLIDSAGRPLELASLKGRTVVLNFWATWCAPCVDEMPELSALHEEIAGANATVIGIGIDSPSNIREFAVKHRFAYPLLVGGLLGAELTRKLGNERALLPFTVVISPSGKIVERTVGRIRLPRLRQVVASTLNAPATAR